MRCSRSLSRQDGAVEPSAGPDLPRFPNEGVHMSLREIAVRGRRQSQIPLLNRPGALGLESVRLGRCLACRKDVLSRDRTVERLALPKAASPRQPQTGEVRVRSRQCGVSSSKRARLSGRRGVMERARPPSSALRLRLAGRPSPQRSRSAVTDSCSFGRRGGGTRPAGCQALRTTVVSAASSSRGASATRAFSEQRSLREFGPVDSPALSPKKKARAH